MSELKPCPFCGGEAINDKDSHPIYCGACYSQMPYGICENDMIKLWNTRSESSEASSIDQSERIKELEQSLSTMTHVAKELYGAISEHSLMPCRSLETRMMATANRYATRIFGE